MAQLVMPNTHTWHNPTTSKYASCARYANTQTHRHNRPTFFVEYKQKAHAITEISKQLRLGKELQLDAAEFLRRAERGLGVAIRDGQDNGTVRKHHASNAQGRLSPLSSPRPTVSPTQAAPSDKSRQITLNGKTPGQQITPKTPPKHARSNHAESRQTQNPRSANHGTTHANHTHSNHVSPPS